VTSQSVKQGITIFKAGNKEKARLIFKEALKSDPNNETAWFWLAATYKKKSNQIKCLQKLLGINPYHQAARQQLAHLLGNKLPPPPPNPKPAPEIKASVEKEDVPPPPPTSPPSPAKPPEPEMEEEPSARSSTQWKNIGLAGLGIFGFLALLIGLLFGNALFSVTDLNTLMSELTGSTPNIIASATPIVVQTTSTAENDAAEVMPLAITIAPPANAAPSPIKTQVLILPTTPPLTHNFPCLPQNTERVQADVIRIVDGDTIEIEYNDKQYSVRFIGINAPETYPKQYFSIEATERTIELLEGKSITLVKDISNTDQYGRLLRYILLEDVFINQLLVNEGYALAATFPPDIACAELFAEAQESARLNNNGLWKNIPRDSKTATPLADTPTPTVEQTCPFGCKIHYPGCDIKGNINIVGEKIYHLPDSEWYDGTIINTSQGERWFCTAEEAEGNGWQPAE
jgi:micrococcal nuclease